MRSERFDFIYLPKQYQKQHNACEFLLYQIEDFVLKNDFDGLRIQSINFNGNEKPLEGEHILDCLIRTNNNEKHNEIITSYIINAVVADICHFLQIALFSSLQKRLTVTFALIRKPFVYDLLLLLRLYFTKDFLDKFNSQTEFDTTGLTQDDIRKLLDVSEEILFSKSIKAADIYDFVFNPSLSDSIVNMSNKALHPSTTRNKNNRTEVQNINFVFSTSDSIETQWDYLYRRLPLLMMYLNEVLEFIVFNHLKKDDSTYTDRLIERAEFFKQNKF